MRNNENSWSNLNICFKSVTVHGERNLRFSWWWRCYWWSLGCDVMCAYKWISVFQGNTMSPYLFQFWRWRQYALLTCSYLPTSPHSVTTEKTTTTPLTGPYLYYCPIVWTKHNPVLSALSSPKWLPSPLLRLQRLKISEDCKLRSIIYQYCLTWASSSIFLKVFRSFWTASNRFSCILNLVSASDIFFLWSKMAFSFSFTLSSVSCSFWFSSWDWNMYL